MCITVANVIPTSGDYFFIDCYYYDDYCYSLKYRYVFYCYDHS